MKRLLIVLLGGVLWLALNVSTTHAYDHEKDRVEISIDQPSFDCEISEEIKSNFELKRPEKGEKEVIIFTGIKTAKTKMIRQARQLLEFRHLETNKSISQKAKNKNLASWRWRSNKILV